VLTDHVLNSTTVSVRYLFLASRDNIRSLVDHRPVADDTALATKKILHVDQPDPWDTITLKFTASLSF
jgi:hypothetical protein